MKQFLRAVRQPLITEKSTILREKDGTYCFRVHLNSNKIEIARAIEKVFEKDFEIPGPAGLGGWNETQHCTNHDVNRSVGVLAAIGSWSPGRRGPH